jgi:hypothetical protein
MCTSQLLEYAEVTVDFSANGYSDSVVDDRYFVTPEPRKMNISRFFSLLLDRNAKGARMHYTTTAAIVTPAPRLTLPSPNSPRSTLYVRWLAIAGELLVRIMAITNKVHATTQHRYPAPERQLQ